MEVDKPKLLELLENRNFTFFIPPYQRNYEWDREQCKVFLGDVCATAEKRAEDKDVEHFFGTIVYSEGSHVFGQPAKLVLVDGQQRITTTMLLIAAIRDLMADEGAKAYINDSYLRNDKVTGSDDEYKIKLKQVETDWPSYRALILGYPLGDRDRRTPVFRNYDYFKRELQKERRSDEDLQQLLSEGLGNLRVVTIQLQPERNKGENPQEIFESMNSLGKVLTLADLVRNWLLMGKDATAQESLYRDWWLPMEEMLGGSGSNQLSNFIRDYMQLKAETPFKKATNTNHKELYAEFKQLFREKDVEAVLPDMCMYAEYYACVAIGAPTGKDKVDRLLGDIRAIGATGCYSFLLGLLRAENGGPMSTAQLEGALSAVFDYLLRRRIVRATQGENKAFPSLVKKVGTIAGAADARSETFEVLASQGFALRLPTNAELASELRSTNFYSFKQSKLLLGLVEQRLTKARPDLSDSSLQLEHIMPQTLNDWWRRELGGGYEDVHGELVDTIGNITLIRHNQELGNSPFPEKRATYDGRAGLQIARTHVTDNEHWRRAEIDARADWIIECIVSEVLPIPSDYDKTSATATKKRRSRLDMSELGLVGETVSFVEDPSITATVVNGSEVEFEGKRHRLSPLTREIKTRAGTVNASGAYQGGDWWTFEGETLADIRLRHEAELDADLDDEGDGDE